VTGREEGGIWAGRRGGGGYGAVEVELAFRLCRFLLGLASRSFPGEGRRRGVLPQDGGAGQREEGGLCRTLVKLRNSVVRVVGAAVTPWPWVTSTPVGPGREEMRPNPLVSGRMVISSAPFL